MKTFAWLNIWQLMLDIYFCRRRYENAEDPQERAMWLFKEQDYTNLLNGWKEKVV